jgi:uncharacterized protein
MSEPAPTLAAEIESLQRAYAALNRGDIAGFVEDFDPDIERVEPPGFPMSGTYRGIDAVTAQFVQARGTWAEGTCAAERFIAAGDKVIVFCHVHVRLHGKTDWIDGEVTDVFTFRDGKVIGYRSFGERRDAMEWAKVSGPFF